MKDHDPAAGREVRARRHRGEGACIVPVEPYGLRCQGVESRRDDVRLLAVGPDVVLPEGVGDYPDYVHGLTSKCVRTLGNPQVERVSSWSVSLRHRVCVVHPYGDSWRGRLRLDPCRLAVLVSARLRSKLLGSAIDASLRNACVGHVSRGRLGDHVALRMPAWTRRGFEVSSIALTPQAPPSGARCTRAMTGAR